MNQILLELEKYDNILESEYKLRDTVKIMGYHATNRKNYESIMKNGLIISENTKNKYHWLGNGIYLFQYPKDAESWGKDIRNCKEDPITLLVESKIEEAKFLDLDNPEDMDRLKTFIQMLFEELYGRDIGNNELHFNNELELVSWGINQFKSVIETDLVKYTFTNPRTMSLFGYNDFTDNYFVKNRKPRGQFHWVGYPYNEVQSCLTDNKNITNKEIYKKE